MRRVLGPTHADTLDSFYMRACWRRSTSQTKASPSCATPSNTVPPFHEDMKMETDKELNSLRGAPRFRRSWPMRGNALRLNRSQTSDSSIARSS